MHLGLNGVTKGHQGERSIVKFCVLASGSSGNVAFVATNRTRILVDAGLSFKELERRLASIGETADRFDAILVTHEHCDHVSGLLRLARKLKLKTPIYVSRLTHPLIDWEGMQPPVERFQAGTDWTIGDIKVESFTIPHDAIDPVGFRLSAEGVKLGIATDLGYMPDSIKYRLQGCQALLLESNHDLEMLKVGPYPWSVKQRVMGRNGHLSNHVVCDYLETDFDNATQVLILGHLSEHNNHPEIVRMGAAQALEQRGVDLFSTATQLVVAEQKSPTEVFHF
jgi:phosphoribosyl 1,2-cyclic phosphodiesterase